MAKAWEDVRMDETIELAGRLVHYHYAHSVYHCSVCTGRLDDEWSALVDRIESGYTPTPKEWAFLQGYMTNPSTANKCSEHWDHTGRVKYGPRR